MCRPTTTSFGQAIATTEFPDPKLLAEWGRKLQKTGRLEESQEAHRRRRAFEIAVSSRSTAETKIGCTLRPKTTNPIDNYPSKRLTCPHEQRSPS